MILLQQYSKIVIVIDMIIHIIITYAWFSDLYLIRSEMIFKSQIATEHEKYKWMNNNIIMNASHPFLVKW